MEWKSLTLNLTDVGFKVWREGWRWKDKLKKFTLKNYKNFKDEVTIDFENIAGYQFNTDCLSEGIIGKMLIYTTDFLRESWVFWWLMYDTIVTPLSIDVSTGDIITPEAVKYEFGGIFDENVKITLWGYNIETVMAEKVETILSRGVFTTRPRDFYDVYILGTTQEYDWEIFKEALKSTAIHRGSLEKIADVKGIIEQISSNDDLKSMWRKYQRKFAYASDISYESIMDTLRVLMFENNL